MRKPGFILVAEPGARNTVIEIAQDLDRRGFSHIYCPTGVDPDRPFGDNLGLCIALAQATDQIEIGTGIANIYARHPAQMADTASFINETSGGRFVLGLGVADPGINALYGKSSEKPLAAMRQYVADMRAAADEQPFPRIMLASMRKKMTRQAGEIADGAIWAMGVRSHMATSLQELPAGTREDFIVGNNIRCVVTDDAQRAARDVRQRMRRILSSPPFQAYFIEAGFGEEMRRVRAAVAADDEAGFLAAVSDRLLDEVTLIGTPSQIRDKVEAWYATGVNRLTIAGTSPEAVRRIADIFD